MRSTLPPSLADLSLEGRVDNMLYMRVYCHYHLYILFILSTAKSNDSSR